MSSILKALKKLEDDASLRRPDELRVNAEILRNSIAPRFSPAMVLTASVLLLAAGSGATYLYMRHGTAPERPQLPAAVIRPPVLQPSGSITKQLPTAMEVIPALPVKQGTSRPHQPFQPAGSTVAAPPASVQTGVTPQKRSSEAPQSSPLPAATTMDIPALRVNGIAFQEEGSGSVAMINGVPVSNGSVIDGVKVEEIHKNRVRFSYNGERFEIYLGQSNRQELH